MPMQNDQQKRWFVLLLPWNPVSLMLVESLLTEIVGVSALNCSFWKLLAHLRVFCNALSLEYVQVFSMAVSVGFVEVPNLFRSYLENFENNEACFFELYGSLIFSAPKAERDLTEG